jgi:transcription initiation factor IIE alpha subunit
MAVKIHSRSDPLKARTLYYCPQDRNELLFEEAYDENCEFAYQPPHELPEVCPRCGRLFFKKDCFTVEELQTADDMRAWGIS